MTQKLLGSKRTDGFDKSNSIRDTIREVHDTQSILKQKLWETFLKVKMVKEKNPHKPYFGRGEKKLTCSFKCPSGQ